MGADRVGSTARLWRLAIAAAAGLVLAACIDEPKRPGPAGAAEAPRVLIVTTKAKSALTERLVAELSAGGLGSPPLPPMSVDVEWAEDAAQAVAAVRRHEPLARYRAIYSHSITFARGAQTVSSEVPIVFEGMDDPVRRCLVDSLQRPGRNATGYMHHLRDDEFKALQLLHDGFPALQQVLMLVAADNLPPLGCDPQEAYWKAPQSPPANDCKPGERPLDSYIERRVDAAELAERARGLGLRLRFVVVCEAGDFAPLAAWGARLPQTGWLVPWQTLFDRNRPALTAALGDSGQPAVYPHHGYTRAGGLMSISPVLDEGAERASRLALLQVLGGADPATLPVQMPRGFTTLFNARQAERMKLKPSLMVLHLADEILR